MMIDFVAKNTAFFTFDIRLYLSSEVEDDYHTFSSKRFKTMRKFTDLFSNFALMSAVSRFVNVRAQKTLIHFQSIEFKG